MGVGGHDFIRRSGLGLLEMDAANQLPFKPVSSPILTVFFHTSPKDSQAAPAYLSLLFLPLLPGLKMEPSYLSQALNFHGTLLSESGTKHPFYGGCVVICFTHSEIEAPFFC